MRPWPTACDRRAPPRQVAAGLSNLGRTAGGGTAYLRLTVAGTDLRDARALARCAHVEDMQLPGNRLACVAALGALSGLASLNVSGNELTRLLDLGQGAPAPAPACGRAAADPAGAAGRRGAPPPAAGSLRDADFGFNKIAVIRDLSGFSRLDRLVLDGNQVGLAAAPRHVCVGPQHTAHLPGGCAPRKRFES